MSIFSVLHSWAVPRRKLLAGLAGVAVEAAVTCVPGVGTVARHLGAMVEKGTEAVLDPATGQPLPPDQLAQVRALVEQMAGSYATLLDRLEGMALPATDSMEALTAALKQALLRDADLASEFDACSGEVRRQALSLTAIEQKLDEHFHGQEKVQASLEEIKSFFVHAPTAREWADFRKARPDALEAVLQADEHFLAGRKREGVAALVALLGQRGVGEQTLAHHIGMLEFGQGKVGEARQHLAEATRSGNASPALAATRARLSTLSRSAGVPVWRSLPRGFLVGRKYRIEAEVGRGGMASVYRAERLVSFEKERHVAVKVPAPALMADPDTRRRFEQEIEVSRQLNQGGHPNILRGFDFEIFDDPHTSQMQYGLVMEFIDGPNLANYLARRQLASDRLGLDEIRHLIAGVCAALEFAHGRGIYHRDLKPHNVLLTNQFGVKLTDFGIARVLADGAGSVTRTEGVVGSVAYMPPELMGRNAVSDARTDVYMAGNLLLELLTFDPHGDLETREDCPPEWMELIADSMNRVRSKRPPTVEAFRARLDGRAPSPASTPAPPPVPVWNVEANWGLFERMSRSYYAPVLPLLTEVCRSKSVAALMNSCEPGRFAQACRAGLLAAVEYRKDYPSFEAIIQAFDKLAARSGALLARLDPSVSKLQSCAAALRAASPAVKLCHTSKGNVQVDRLLLGTWEARWGADDEKESGGSEGATGVGAATGGVIGTALFPGVGTLIGAGLGAWLGSTMGEKERTPPDTGGLKKHSKAFRQLVEAVRGVYETAWGEIVEEAKARGGPPLPAFGHFTDVLRKWEALHVQLELGKARHPEVKAFINDQGPCLAAVQRIFDGCLLQGWGDREAEARGWLEQQFRLFPAGPETLTSATRYLLAQRDFTGALAAAERGLQSSPDHAGLKLARVEALAALQRPAEAEEQARALAKQSPPGDPWLACVRGAIHSGDFDRVVATARAWLAAGGNPIDAGRKLREDSVTRPQFDRIASWIPELKAAL